jgi:hypothetical protein
MEVTLCSTGLCILFVKMRRLGKVIDCKRKHAQFNLHLAQFFSFWKYKIAVLFLGPHKPKVKKSSQNKELEIHGWCPYIFEAISYNGLPYFLIANIFTGVINFLFDTVRSSELKALLILFCYTFAIHFVIVFLYKRKLCFKFS